MVDLTVSRRAETAIRSLASKEEADVKRWLTYLQKTPPAEVMQAHRMKRLHLPGPGNFYSLRATGELRLILSLERNGWVVEDIFDRERVEAWVPRVKER
jgi:hypothetical protein